MVFFNKKILVRAARTAAKQQTTKLKKRVAAMLSVPRRSTATRKNKQALRIRKMLVPVDGSEISFNTAKYALQLAKMSGATVTLLHVSTIPAFPRYLASLDVYEKEVRGQAMKWFDAIKKYPEAAGVRIRTRVITAALSIVGSIVEAASREDTDLIAIGPRGRSGFTKLLLGSVTSGVATYAPCPVLVVR